MSCDAPDEVTREAETLVKRWYVRQQEGEVDAAAPAGGAGESGRCELWFSAWVTCRIEGTVGKGSAANDRPGGAHRRRNASDISVLLVHLERARRPSC